jgi:hypothetical protein
MRKRIRALLVIVVIACLLLLAAWKFTPREPLLLEEATDVSPQGISYCWLNNEELLRTRQGQARAVLLRRNVRTGEETAPDALKKCEEGITELQPSPDGKYLLWSEQGEVGGNYGFAVADGSHYFAQKDMNATLWMPDSRHWLEFKANEDENSFEAILHNMEAPHEKRTLAIEQGESIRKRDFYGCVVTPDNRLLAHGYSFYNGNDNTITVEEYAVGNTIKPVRFHLLKLPRGTTLSNEKTDVKESPQGRQVALRLESQRVPSLVALLGRYLPFFKTEPRKCVELWVCDLDGKNLRLVGYVVEQPAAKHVPLQAYTPAPSIVQDLAWTPDGRKISFTNEGRIYTIPIGTD